MAFVFLIQFTVIKMENLEHRLLSLIHFMIMIQLFPLVFVFQWEYQINCKGLRLQHKDVLVIVSWPCSLQPLL